MLLLLQILYDNDKNHQIGTICSIQDQDEKEWELRKFSDKLKKKSAPDFHQALKIYKIMRIRMKISW